MKRFLLPAALVALSSLAGGCVDDTLGLAISKFIALDATMTCMPSVSSTMVQTSGTWDVAIDQAGVNSGFRGFSLSPVVVNNLIERATATTGEMDAIDVTGFDVQLKPDPNDSSLQAAIPPADRAYFVPAAGGRITPGGILGPMSQTAITVEIIPQTIAKLINDSLAANPPNPSNPPRPIIVHLRPVGIHAGLKINGGYVDFPVNVCRNCLGTTDQQCPAGGVDTTMVTIQKQGCFPWQDFPVTCCQQAGQLLCGANVPVKKG